MLLLVSTPVDATLSYYYLQVKTSWLDGKHVVFGRVVEGMDIVKEIESLGSQSGKTAKRLVIADCGQL